ncbi:hypothetical protein [Abyssisolibacter fermentans]|nr:hypothetical protein [Abyssisolibacter fermentans]
MRKLIKKINKSTISTFSRCLCRCNSQDPYNYYENMETVNNENPNNPHI